MGGITDVRVNKFELKHSDVDDPVAQKVSWNPVKPGGANFRTHKLNVSSMKISVERSKGMILFGSIFMGAGMIPVFIGLSSFAEGNWGVALGAIAFGGVFVAVGVFSLGGKDLLTFDKARGVYFRGGKYGSGIRPDRRQQGHLSDIYALQLVSEMVSGGKSGPYTSYELNVVFADGERMNVMDHGDGAAIENSAKQLGAFLGVTVWKAVY